MSYANVVSSGTATTPAPIAQESIVQESVSKSEQVESTPEPIEVETNEEESKTQNQLPSPNPSPKAEKKPKEVNLAPAPVPSVSAWGSASSSRSNSNVSSVDSKHWPSPLDSQLTSSNGNTPKKINQVKSSKEKWIPFKASVVLPTPGSKKSNGQKRNSNKNNNVLNNSNTNKQAHNDAKKRKNKTEKRPTSNGTTSTVTESKELPAKPELKNEESKESSTKSEESEQPKQESTTSTQASSTSPSIEKSHNNNNTQHQSNNHQSNNHYNQHQHHNQHHNNRYQNNNQYNQHQQAFIPFQPFPIAQNPYPLPTNGQRQFRPYNNRRFNKYQNNGFNNNNNGQYRQNNYFYNNRRTNVAHLNKSSEPLLSLIKQIEYYFSIENLLKDIFLRKQMNNEGWLELTVISSFYRMNVLSAGDFQLVRRAIDELNGELLELAEFGESKTLKVRVKENFETWVLPTDHRDPRGLDETPLLNVIEPIVKDVETSETNEENKEEETSKETTAEPVEA
ncbi:putative RNA-binding protein [Wickerhamomyces ciferrii]|uniref:RNA-binding protein n=1 Tax=Wickerhamomyces ciferrii (strain ATCC 14091 / BCRC 22168 / CBS 111 / JCM 3599 / NBRC 0793 / NRRL Y-1031 F-60-10) TaxID=1206466 RepID=K0KWQ5_WICCF|nr:putative RNA-binding protein [Wickerhamomyces ciferrii]CCH46462.1 putative RNA-binding protein [Wickerhamomyces ciferrii]